MWGANVGDHFRAAVANVLQGGRQQLEQAIFARGPGARVEIGAWPSGRSAGISIIEVPAMAGFGWSFALGRRVELEPAVQGGVLIHAWRFDGIRRAAIDGNFELPIELAVRVGRALRVAIVPSIGVTTRARRHVVADDTAWSRGSLRGGIALGIAWQPERSR